MARLDRFMIAPLEKGQQSNVKPWLVPDNAFAQLRNAYAWRGRVKKRFGSYAMQGTITPTQGYEQLQSRLRVAVYDNTSPMPSLAITSGTGTYSGTLNVGYKPFAIGQAFSIGNQIFTLYDITGTTAKFVSTGSAVFALDTNTCVCTVTGAAINTQIYFFPSLPVMGFLTYNNGVINNAPLYAFDTKFAYEYTSSGWNVLGQLDLLGDPWTGSDSQFFWGTTWIGDNSYDNILFVTNFNQPDNVAYWNGTNWYRFAPIYNKATGYTIQTARIVIPFKDRLLLLNTVEQVAPSGPGMYQQFFNRCRFSQNGSPIQADAWEEDTPGKGGYIDCPVKEQILTAQFLRDHLIVFFENSTWELVYTQNQILPFVWQQINTELGAESTFSEVPFDQQVLGIGAVGVHECAGANVNRIDMLIPDEVFSISKENNGTERVAGIRDYFTEMVYWTYPYNGIQAVGKNDKFPNRLFIYNYRNQSWAFNDDSITAFGYYYQKLNRTWQDMQTQWQAETSTWAGPELTREFKQIIAGNQQGYTFIIDPNEESNIDGLQITDIQYDATTQTATFTVLNHNRVSGDYITISNMQYTGSGGPVDTLHPVYVIDSVTDYNTFTIIVNAADFAFAGTHGSASEYRGGGVIALVTPVDIWTKQYNFYADQGKNAHIPMIDFMVDKTSDGQITVDYYTSTSSWPLVNEGIATGSISGTNILETSPYADNDFEASQERLWHRIYLQAIGNVIQMHLYLTPDQVMNAYIPFSRFELHAFVIYAQAVGRLQ